MAKICPVCGTTYADNSVFCPTDGTTLRGEEITADLVGSVIADRYLISKLLGEGGMGRVYLARHVRLPQQAAIKVMHPGMVKDQEAVARFNREAANAARIEHDRVARVFDFGETHEGLVYLAMEFVPGQTLRSLLEESTRLPPARAANIAFQVAEGLDAAHRIPIVHRDLKPDNIMVVTDEQGVDRCKVVDFGIAKAADGGGAQTQLTRTGVLIGTPEFMSPEQVVGEPLDARSDVYALALVAYQMFTGVLPFTAATVERSLAARLIDDPRPLALAAPDVAWPAALQVAFDRALDREPATRTASALEFGDAVVAAVESWTGAAVLRGRTPLNTASITVASGAASAAPASTPAMASLPAATQGAGAGTAAAVQASSSAGAPVAAAGGGGRRAVLAGAAVLVLAVVAWGVFLRDRGAAANPPAGGEKAPNAVVSQPADAAARNAKTGGSTIVPRTTAPGTQGEKSAPVQEKLPAVSAATAIPSVTTPTAAGSAAVVTTAGGGALAAKKELDSLNKVLEDPATDESDARAAIPQLQRLLTRLGSASDSTWAYLALVSAYGQAGETLSACPALRSAKRLAKSDAQIRAVNNFVLALSCAP
jgi:serine/threonine-protein kinase